MHLSDLLKVKEGEPRAVVAQAKTESPQEARQLRAGLTFARMVAHNSASAIGVIV